MKLIKKLSATPTLSAQSVPHRSATPIDSQAALQANRATFFFQLVRQIPIVPTSRFGPSKQLLSVWVGMLLIRTA